MSRLPPQTRDQLQPAQQDLHDHFNDAVRRAVGKDPGNVDTASHQDSSQAALGGPFPFLSVLPSIGRLSLDMIAGLGQVLHDFPPDARETASLVCTSYYKSDYATSAHTKIARSAAMLTDAQIEAITSATRPSDLNHRCTVAYDAAFHLLHIRGALPQDLWDQCLLAFGKEGTVGLVH
ncbi:hypothetical protein LTR97_008725 [Elasticomyces elasticus]|uniref:Uncharacterized protein n=1 Tax=Elasticomyces elasticus TaxID=574655 RepID=A0AAN7W636_9PEZI|nr:hypothetical protein LTR97_008725 [Elasticomyces elasticus]